MTSIEDYLLYRIALLEDIRDPTFGP